MPRRRSGWREARKEFSFDITTLRFYARCYRTRPRIHFAESRIILFGCKPMIVQTGKPIVGDSYRSRESQMVSLVVQIIRFFPGGRSHARRFAATINAGTLVGVGTEVVSVHGNARYIRCAGNFVLESREGGGRGI